jgi:hypothetical protein
MASDLGIGVEFIYLRAGVVEENRKHDSKN